MDVDPTAKHAVEEADDAANDAAASPADSAKENAVGIAECETEDEASSKTDVAAGDADGFAASIADDAAGRDAGSSAKHAKTPLVSVIVPTYNVEDDLPECLDSLVGQTLENIEIIIVDDGSTDSSGDIAQEYAREYDNIAYHRIENQGLGHARNWGARLATGEFLFFPDSDDIVEVDALERMVDAAQTHDADIVIGDADRFNTKKRWSDSLHRKALAGDWEAGHVSTHPQLVYDSTAWNKIYRRSFYERENTTWAEGMLYEDIPTTLPLHFKAKKVARIDGIIYHWRFRDGSSKSITQNQSSLDNFRDRMKAIRSNDAFFDEHVEDRDLHLAKDRKLLDIDFPLYLDKVDNAEDEFTEEVCSTLREYLNRLDERALAKARAIERLKLHYVSQGDIEGLKAVRKYQNRGYDTLKVRKVGDRFIGKFPLEGVTDELCDMTEELRATGLRTRVRQAQLDESGLVLDIRVNMKRTDFKHVKLAAYLVDMQGNVAATFDCAKQRVRKKRKIEVSKDYRAVLVKNQRARRWRLTLGQEPLTSLSAGAYRVELHVENDGLVCDPVQLAHPESRGGAKPMPALVDGRLVHVEYDYRRTMKVVVSDNPSAVDDIALDEDGVFHLACANGTVKEFNPNVDGDKLAVQNCYFGPTPRYFYRAVDESEPEELWRAIEQRDGVLRISRMEPGAVCMRCTQKGWKLRMDVDVPPSLADSVSAVAFRGRLFRAEARMPLAHDDTGTYAVIDFADEGCVGSIRDDNYDVFVEGIAANGKHLRWPLYCAEDARDALTRVQKGGYRYHFDRRYPSAIMRVHRIRKFYERTELERRMIQYVAYPLMRKLPVKKRLVVFESYFAGSTDCNPGALYRHMEKHHRDYRLTWILHDSRIPGGKGARSVVPDTLPYFWSVARAQYLVTNTDLPGTYVKRAGQTVLQTMHGTPLKHVGLDVETWAPTEERRAEYIERTRQWDYITVQNIQTEGYARSAYGYEGGFLNSGYPRTDELIARDTPEQQAACKRRLGLDPSKKLVLYAPTWRIGRRFDLHLDLARMSDELGDGWEFALRRHNLSLPGFTMRERMGTTVRDLTYEPRIDDLLLAADVLVTDYSSVMFDYALLDRPMLFFTYDLEEYRDDLRGFYFDFERETPGPLLRTTDEVIDALRNLDATKAKWADAYAAFKDVYLAFETDHSCEDVFRQAFEGERP